MNLTLTNIERELLRQSLMDTMVNSNNFREVEKDVLEEIYHRIKDYEDENKIYE